MNDAQAWELADWDTVETTERLKRREVSVPEVVEAAITRARDASGLGAVVTPTFERAMAAATKNPTGPLAGVPFFIKDLAQQAGVRTAWGTKAAGEYVSPRNDPTVTAFERAGLISLGKSATPELGLTATTEPLGFEPTRNPWNPKHSTGGSSGGAAALVAAGVVPLAHGSDGGGSIRIPASCCGLVGLKPTRGRLDMEGSNLLPVNIAVHGILTRTVRDTVAFWGALEQGRSRKWPAIGQLSPQPPKRLRIAAYAESPMEQPVHPDAVASVEQAMKLCERLGHDVQRVPCPVPRQVTEDFLRLWGFVAFAQAKGAKVLMHLGVDTKKFEPWTVGFGRYFSSEPGLALAAMRRLRGFTKAWAKMMARYDVVLSPTLAQPPVALGHLTTDQPFDLLLARVIEYTPFAAPINAAGAPALSLPLARSTTGLPMGVQFAGAHGQEKLLLELGRQLEEASPWPKRAPKDLWLPLPA
jgi:amidase